MISVTRLNGEKLVINAEMIVTVETTPDTVVNLVGSKKYLLKESAQEVIDLVVSYRAAIISMMPFYSGQKHSG